MADNRADTRRDMRTALSRAKGLGAAHHGVEHWWLHRLTAMSNIPLITAFIIIVASLAWRPYGDAVRVLGNPLIAVILLLCVASVTNHMRLGLQIVIDDYVHDRGLKIASTVANNFFAIAIAAVCLFSILKISFGRAPLPPV